MLYESSGLRYRLRFVCQPTFNCRQATRECLTLRHHEKAWLTNTGDTLDLFEVLDNRRPGVHRRRTRLQVGVEPGIIAPSQGILPPLPDSERQIAAIVAKCAEHVRPDRS